MVSKDKSSSFNHVILPFSGASLPFRNGFDWQFNQMGLHLDLALKDQAKPFMGGKAHVELPVFKLGELLPASITQADTFVDSNNINKQVTEKNIVGQMFDIKTIKSDITFNGENGLIEGLLAMAFDYTIINKDGSERTGTLSL